MTDSGVIASVGTTSDSYDSLLAGTVNGLYKSDGIEYREFPKNCVTAYNPLTGE